MSLCNVSVVTTAYIVLVCGVFGYNSIILGNCLTSKTLYSVVSLVVLSRVDLVVCLCAASVAK